MLRRYFTVTCLATLLAGDLARKPKPQAATKKIYRALLTQAGEAAPVANVLENTLGGEVEWARRAPGLYIATLAGAFPDESQIFGLRSYQFAPTSVETVRLQLQWDDENETPGNALLLTTYNVEQESYRDSLLAGIPIQFEVYS